MIISLSVTLNQEHPLEIDSAQNLVLSPILVWWSDLARNVSWPKLTSTLMLLGKEKFSGFNTACKGVKVIGAFSRTDEQLFLPCYLYWLNNKRVNLESWTIPEARDALCFDCETVQLNEKYIYNHTTDFYIYRYRSYFFSSQLHGATLFVLFGMQQ